MSRQVLCSRSRRPSSLPKVGNIFSSASPTLRMISLFKLFNSEFIVMNNIHLGELIEVSDDFVSDVVS